MITTQQTDLSMLPPLAQLEAADYMCERLAQSRLVPAAYRGDPANIFLAYAEGRKFGWDITTAMGNIHVINGRACLSATAQLGIIRAAGHQVKIDATDQRCHATGVRYNTGERHQVTFSLDDAKRANLMGRDVWRQYPRAMLRSRAVTELGRILFSDVLLGIQYAPDEIPGGPDVTVDDAGDVVVVDTEAKPIVKAREPVPEKRSAPKSVKALRTGAKHAVMARVRDALTSIRGDASNDEITQAALQVWCQVVTDDTDTAQLRDAKDAAEDFLSPRLDTILGEVMGGLDPDRTGGYDADEEDAQAETDYDDQPF